jgi:hypothetical protein
MTLIDCSALSDSQLTIEVARLAQSERHATVALIAHLTELYGRRLHERAGYGSLFAYCVGVLRLSESAAYDRMKAAKVARRFPAVLALLGDGRLNLTTVRLVAPHITASNHRDLLGAVTGMSKRQVQEALARRFPQPDVRASVRKLPTPAAVAERVAATPVIAAAAPDASAGTPGPVLAASPRPAVPAPTPEPVKPLSPDRYRITFTASAAACEKLEMARDLLRESHAKGDHSRHIPADVKRTVYVRDGGRCAYVSPEGRRCEQRGFLELHHVEPYAAGGKATAGNISLRCRAHNRYEAEVFYGPAREHGGIGMPERASKAEGASTPERARVTAATFSCRNERQKGIYTPGPCP